MEKFKLNLKKQGFSFLLMTVPAFILFFIFHTFPALQGVFYSFTNWNGLKKDFVFTGLSNYKYLFNDSRVISAYIFTFKFAIISTILVNVISLMLATVLHSNILFKKFFRAVFFLPNILSILIIGFIFNYFFSNVLPEIGSQLDIEYLSKNILGNKDLAWIGVVFVAVWQSAAFNTILYIAGLQTVPADLYEAASMDGANTWGKFVHVTFPTIFPFFIINMVLSMKNFLMVFDHVLSITGGGPGGTTQSISVLIYQSGLAGGEFAYQSANAVLYMIIIMIISIAQLKFLQKREA